MSAANPSPSNATPGKPGDDARYLKLAAEAAQIHGVSLWLDAWRRLRRNYAAMASLVLLALLLLLAVSTPLLPLQSPQFQRISKEWKYHPPTLQSVRLELDPAQIVAADEEIAKLKRIQLLAKMKRWEEISPLLDDDDKKRLKFDTADHNEFLPLLEQELAAAAKQHPFGRLWNAPGLLTSALLRARLALFGGWCLPSLCGTDELGRDILARICWGARVSILVSLLATLVSLVIGVSYGAVAGYFGGAIDAVMMEGVNILYSIPFIFVVIYVQTILGEDQVKLALAKFGVTRDMIFYLLIGAIYWLTMSRVVRGQVISLRHEQFIDAARTSGAGWARIVFRHVVPNTLGVVTVYLTLTIPNILLLEAFLSFLGLGVQPPDVSWGLLIDSGMKEVSIIQFRWWLVVFPGLALSGTLFALNFLGDGLRDALDPRLKNR